MLAKLFATLTGRSPSFDSWDGDLEQLKSLSVKKDTKLGAKVLNRMWDINLSENHDKPGWIMSVDDDGRIDSLSCFRAGEGKADNLEVTGSGYVLSIRIEEGDIRKDGPCVASERHFVQYLSDLCRTQLR